MDDTGNMTGRHLACDDEETANAVASLKTYSLGTKYHALISVF